MRGFFSRGVEIAWLFAFIALLGNAFLSVRNLDWLANNEARLRESYRSMQALQELLSTMKDAETGQRGYLITGKEKYLSPYTNALDRLGQQQRDFRTEFGNNESAAKLDELDRLIADKLHELQLTIVARRGEGGYEKARDLVMTDRGQQKMDGIRNLIGKLNIQEEEELQKRTLDSKIRYQTSIAYQVLGAAIGLGMTLLAFLAVRQELAFRHRTEAALKRARDELDERVRQRTVELSLSNAALAQSNLELEQFASVASHDLQEPLRKIQTFGSRLQTRCSSQLGQQGLEYLERITSAAGRMRQLIEDLLAFSRLTTRKGVVGPVDLNTLIQEVTTDLEGLLQHSAGTVRVDPLPVVEGDPLQLRQLFQNLIANALKFRKANVAPQVHIGGEIVEADRGQPAFAEIKVQDNGIGFDEVFRERIFRMFERLHPRGEYEGTGIGLALCRKIVERHGGQISATSQPGQGATFVVSLPVRSTR
jgi:signal transduction histidine kinase